MKYRAMLKQVDGWWIGWLIDLPGVHAQDMLSTPIPFEENTIMTIIEIPEAA
ncbi:MAG: type II toxin-antitoxin system HicB family antitoxin [Methylobacter sp.]|nr:MAG: type II toxin-antitoxin system HicB family antitoxin [Methylobacter sp.]